MRIGVVDQPHIDMLEGTVVPYTVLLQGLGVKDHDLQTPHHRNCPQHYLFAPEVPPQQPVEVSLEAEGTSMGHSRICNTIGSSQCRVHVDKHLLPVLHHPVHHLVMEVSGGVVRQVPVTVLGTRNPTMVNLETLFDGREQTIPIAFNLRRDKRTLNQILKHILNRVQ